MSDTYITLSKASKKYSIDRHKLKSIAENIYFQQIRKGAVINSNKGGKTAKYVFHEATLIEYFSVDSTQTAIKRRKKNGE